MWSIWIRQARFVISPQETSESQIFYPYFTLCATFVSL
jgi:hypothetical protein